MKFYKIALILILTSLLLIIKFYFFSTSVKFIVVTESIEITDEVLNLPLTIRSTKDAIYKFTFKIQHGKKKIDIPQSYIVALKKGQQYELNFQLQKTEFNFKHFQPKFVLETTLEEIFPRTRKIKKLITIKPPEEKPTTTLEITTPLEISTQQPVASTQPVEKQMVLSEQKVETVEQPKIDYVITLNTETLKKDYKYAEKIQISLKINNKSPKVNISPNITSWLKNVTGIIISSTNVQFNLKPSESKDVPVEFNFTEDFLPGFYYLEFIVTINNKQHLFLTEMFQLVDTTPTIILSETPIIKYKQTNTIIVEVEDDRGVNEVKLVRIDKKRNLYIEQPMILIAGSKKAGLYSFTTEKIVQKDFYTFYIQAVDTFGNIAKTEVFNIKISK